MLEKIGDKKIMLGLIVLQLAVCIPFINSFPIGLDEPFSIFWSQQGYDEMIGMLQNENNPPLHFLLLNGWIKLFGIGPIAVRSLSLLFATGSVAALYSLAKKITTKEVAVLSVLLFIFSTFNHYHAIEARAYSMVVFFSIMIFHDLYRFVFEDKKIFWRLAIWNVLLLYTHYLGGFIIGCEVLVLLLFYKKLTKKHYLFYAYTGILSAIGYIPGLLLLLKRLGHFSDKGTWVPDAQISELYGNVLRFFNSTWVSCILLALLLVFGVFGRIGIKNSWRDQLFSDKKFFVFVAFLVPYIGLFILSVIFQPLFLDRYLLFTTPFLYLSFAIVAGFVLQEKSRSWYSLVFAIPMIAGCYFIPETNRDGDDLAAFVSENKGREDVVLISPPFYDLNFMYHFDIKAFQNYENWTQNLSSEGIFPIYNLSEVNLDGAQKIIMIDADLSFLYPDNTIIQELNTNYEWQKSEAFKGNYFVHIYK